MHVAHSSTSRVGLPFANLVAELVGGVVGELALSLLLPRLATCGELEPPHAARPIAAAPATAASRRARGG
jgi:hypothetical protein